MPRGRVSASAVTITTTNETIVATLTGLVTRPGDAVDLEGVVQVTAGTGATALLGQIRRGTTTAGTLVGTGFSLATVAASQRIVVVQVTDFPPESAGLAYVLTITQTAATANGSGDFATLNAIWGI